MLYPAEMQSSTTIWHVYAEPPNRYPPQRSGALTSVEEEQ